MYDSINRKAFEDSKMDKQTTLSYFCNQKLVIQTVSSSISFIMKMMKSCSNNLNPVDGTVYFFLILGDKSRFIWGNLFNSGILLGCIVEKRVIKWLDGSAGDYTGWDVGYPPVNHRCENYCICCTNQSTLVVKIGLWSFCINLL